MSVCLSAKQKGKRKAKRQQFASIAFNLRERETDNEMEAQMTHGTHLPHGGHTTSRTQLLPLTRHLQDASDMSADPIFQEGAC